jgi:hypothetical protein
VIAVVKTRESITKKSDLTPDTHPSHIRISFPLLTQLGFDPTFVHILPPIKSMRMVGLGRFRRLVVGRRRMVMS